MGFMFDKLLEYSETPPKRCGYDCCFYIVEHFYVDSLEFFTGNNTRPHCGIDKGKPVAGNPCRLDNYVFTIRLLELL